MTGPEYIKLADSCQSYRVTKKGVNQYVCVDDWQMRAIMDDRVYVLVTEDQYSSLCKGEVLSAEFIFDQRTLNEFIDPDTKMCDVGKLNEALQILPYADKKDPSFRDGHAVYRNHIACFVVDEKHRGELRFPTAICQANNQFGKGGAHESFIPEKEFKKLQEDGILHFSKADSLDKDHCINHIVPRKIFTMIKRYSKERTDNCIKHGNAPHPVISELKGGFRTAAAIDGIPFRSAVVDRFKKAMDKTSSVVRHSLSGVKTKVASKRASAPKVPSKTKSIGSRTSGPSL